MAAEAEGKKTGDPKPGGGGEARPAAKAEDKTDARAGGKPGEKTAARPDARADAPPPGKSEGKTTARPASKSEGGAAAKPGTKEPAKTEAKGSAKPGAKEPAKAESKGPAKGGPAKPEASAGAGTAGKAAPDAADEASIADQMIGDDARDNTQIRRAVESGAPPEGGQKVVLVVDDKKAVRDIITYTLRNAGYGVLDAEDGWAALKVLAEGTVNGVILDVMMPKIDGYEVARRVRQMAEKIKEIPIIMCTAKDTRMDIINAIKAGANDYIVKPFSKDTLLGKVRKLVGDPV